MKRFDKDRALNKLKIKQNKNTYIKRLSISLSCMFLIIVVMLFTFAKYISNSPEYTLINGRVDSSSGDVNIVSYVYDGTSNSEPPQKSQGYILTDLTCTNATGEWDDLNWKLTVSELSNKVKCTLTFDNNSNYKIIELNSNGGYLAEQYIKGTIGEQLGTLPTPIKTGYTFEGWYKEASLTTQVQSTTVVDSSLTTLYAKYNENTTTINTLGQSNVLDYAKVNFTLPNGYVATSSITGVTPSSSGTQFNSGVVNMTSSGYAYTNQIINLVTATPCATYSGDMNKNETTNITTPSKAKFILLIKMNKSSAATGFVEVGDVENNSYVLYGYNQGNGYYKGSSGSGLTGNFPSVTNNNVVLKSTADVAWRYVVGVYC